MVPDGHRTLPAGVWTARPTRREHRPTSFNGAFALSSLVTSFTKLNVLRMHFFCTPRTTETLHFRRVRKQYRHEVICDTLDAHNQLPLGAQPKSITTSCTGLDCTMPVMFFNLVSFFRDCDPTLNLQL